MHKIILRPFLLSSSLLLGCATMHSDSSLPQVQRVVEERIGTHVQWDQGSPDDKEVRQAIDELLKKELSSDAAVEVALLNNRNVRATYQKLGIAQADLVQAGLLRNPVFGTEVRWALNGSGVNPQFSVIQDFMSIFQLPLRKRGDIRCTNGLGCGPDDRGHVQ